MAQVAWLGKKSPFCGNVTYGLSTTESLRQRGHTIHFIHFDTPAAPLGPSLGRGDGLNRSRSSARRFGAERFRLDLGLHDPGQRGPGQQGLRPTADTEVGRATGQAMGTQAGQAVGQAEREPEVTLSYLVKSQVYTIPSPGALRELRESLERIRPDLVHASLTLSPLDFLLPDLCQQLGLPLVATFHPAFDAGLRNLSAGTQQLTYQLYAPSLARFDRVIVFSELQAEVLERLGVRRERLAVIPNGVDTDLWTPAPSAAPSPSAAAPSDGTATATVTSPAAETPRLAELRRRYAGRRVFLYMGRITTEKNLEALLKAWRLVRPAGCLLLIVGDGPLRASLQNSGESDVEWWGYEGDLEQRIALMQLAEVFLLPSLVEGLSLALLEAMASGAACVATDAGADGEVLDGGAGIVISTQGVTTQLRTLLPVLQHQPVLTAELGRRARARALERYTLTRNIDSLERLYGQLLGQPQAV